MADRGTWVNLGEDSEEWECSECGYIVTAEDYPANGIDQYYHCPSCGADNTSSTDVRTTLITDFDDDKIGEIARALLAEDDGTFLLDLLAGTLADLESIIDITPFL